MTSDRTPGSPEAVAAGCLCPVLDNAHGRGWRPAPMTEPDGEPLFAMRVDCPLHGFPDQITERTQT